MGCDGPIHTVIQEHKVFPLSGSPGAGFGKLWPMGQIQPVCINKVLLEHRHSFIHILLMAAVLLQWQS